MIQNFRVLNERAFRQEEGLWWGTWDRLKLIGMLFGALGALTLLFVVSMGVLVLLQLLGI